MDIELLEFLLSGPLGPVRAREAASRLMARHASLARLLGVPWGALEAEPDLGMEGAALLKSIHSAALRMVRTEVADLPVLSNWDRLMDYLTAALSREPTEQFRVLFLDPKNRLIADEILQRGTVNHAPVYPREVVRRALELNSTAMILVHNHPSGDPTPSRDDVEITRAVVQAARALDLVVHDHVIIGSGSWMSLHQLGLLNDPG